MGVVADDRVRATTCPADDLVQDDGEPDGCDVPDWLRRALGLPAEWGGSALVRLVLFRVAPGRGGDLVGDRRDASALVWRRHLCRRQTRPDDRRAGDSLDEESLGGPA